MMRRRNPAQRPVLSGGTAVALALLLAGGALLGRDGYLRLKGGAAEVLIGRAFAAHLRDGAPHPPWGWADLYPVALLEIPRLGVRRHVLSGASGTTLAFGAGHVDGTSRPNGPGNCVLAGHRDRAFRFLADLAIGDRVELLTPAGRMTWWVEEVRVVHESDVTLLDPGPPRRLTLLTCYPFGALLPSPWRYAVLLRPAENEAPCGEPGGGHAADRPRTDALSRGRSQGTA